MSSYTPLSLSLYPSNLTGITNENRYWKQFKLINSGFIKHYAKITHITFQPNKPYDFAISSSTRVSIFLYM